MYEPASVLLSAVATLAATFGITFYAMTTKSDFTKWLSSFYGNKLLIQPLLLDCFGSSCSYPCSTSSYSEVLSLTILMPL